MARLNNTVRAPGRPSASPVLTPRVARSLVLYITFDAARWRVDRLVRVELDVLLQEMEPRELDAYHDWRMRWLHAQYTVHENPGMEWSF